MYRSRVKSGDWNDGILPLHAVPPPAPGPAAASDVGEPVSRRSGWRLRNYPGRHRRDYSARRDDNEVRRRACKSGADAALCLCGALMGAGSSLIPGGNDGLLLVGMPLAICLDRVCGNARGDSPSHAIAAQVISAR